MPKKGKRQLHLNLNLIGTGAHPGGWHWSSSGPRGFLDLEHYKRVAQLAERACLDAIFFSDQLSFVDDISTPPGWAMLDPTVLVSVMVASTERLGFLPTISTSYNHPYNIARAFSSLNHLSHGRIGLNLVTSTSEAAAANFGVTPLPNGAERYARAEEFAECLISLWGSWEEEALITDPSQKRFLDSNRVHKINHAGRHFSVAGPFQLPRSRHGGPVLFQAGGSDEGKHLAVRFADAVFCAAQTMKIGKAYREDLRNRAEAAGRSADSIAVLPGLNLIIGSTEEEAWKRKAQLDELAGFDDECLRSIWGKRLGIPAELVELDIPVDSKHQALLAERSSSQGLIKSLSSLIEEENASLRQIMDRGITHRRVIGTPDQIADYMEEWFTGGAADGFNLNLDVLPDSIEVLTDALIPVLRKRGLFREAYAETSLKERLASNAL